MTAWEVKNDSVDEDRESWSTIVFTHVIALVTSSFQNKYQDYVLVNDRKWAGFDSLLSAFTEFFSLHVCFRSERSIRPSTWHAIFKQTDNRPSTLCI